MEKLNENQLQVVLTGVFGDGSISTPKQEGYSSRYTTNCKFKDYLEFKSELLGSLSGPINLVEKNGYSQTPIYVMNGKSHPDLWKIKCDNIQNNLDKLTDLGRALWFYDDGSLHKKNLFYNLNTHAFSEEVHYDILVPYFKDQGFGTPGVLKDRKKDGREFSYLYFAKTKGAFEVNELLRKYPIISYKYKLWPDDIHQEIKSLRETIIETGYSSYEDLCQQVEKIRNSERSRKMWETRKAKQL